MNNPTLHPPQRPAGLTPRATSPEGADRFLECLREIEKTGQLLQQALYKRHTEQIWQAVEQQEQAMQRFAQCYREYYGAHDETVQPPPESESIVKDVVRRIKKIYRTNRAIAQSFLEVIDRTLTGLSATQGGNPFVYDSTGRIGPMNGPLLVQQKG
ncbi:MAG TPA: hypothetical protein DCZ95_08515 [Verrucomicrobia bacterium]|nr:MAG: hypothetical protein A2X46_12550 [Lentisphaerae bacterium GWF2_57_35]HBA84121.1 hypothetical protein [Verrucomicrobiota bacterium]